MKIFNVSLRVSITQIAEIPDNPSTEDSTTPPAESYTDDPMKQQERILNKYMDRVERLNSPPPIPLFPGDYGDHADGASMSKNIRIQADTFEDLDAVLRMFADTTKAIRAVPDEIMRAAVPTPAVPSRWG